MIPSPRSWQLALKLFLPSWNFFNRISCISRVEVRLFSVSYLPNSTARLEPPWIDLYPQHLTSSILRTVFNPKGNRELLEKSFFERALGEISELSDSAQFAESSTYARLTSLVNARVEGLKPLSAFEGFQYRIVVIDLQGPHDRYGGASSVPLLSGRIPLRTQTKIPPPQSVSVSH